LAVAAGAEGGAPPASPHAHACGKHMEQPSIELGVLQMCVAALYGATMMDVGSQHRSRCEVCCSNVCVPLIAPEGRGRRTRGAEPRQTTEAHGDRERHTTVYALRACVCALVPLCESCVPSDGSGGGGVAKASGSEQTAAAAAAAEDKAEDRTATRAPTKTPPHHTPPTTERRGRKRTHRGVPPRRGKCVCCAAGGTRRAGLRRAVAVAFVGCAAFPAHSTNHALTRQQHETTHTNEGNQRPRSHLSAFPVVCRRRRFLSAALPVGRCCCVVHWPSPRSPDAAWDISSAIPSRRRMCRE
jgi:hypothetical protein